MVVVYLVYIWYVMMVWVMTEVTCEVAVVGYDAASNARGKCFSLYQ